MLCMIIEYMYICGFGSGHVHELIARTEHMLCLLACGRQLFSSFIMRVCRVWRFVEADRFLFWHPCTSQREGQGVGAHVVSVWDSLGAASGAMSVVFQSEAKIELVPGI